MAPKEKIRLYVIAPDPDDGTSFYRAWGPLLSLTREHPHIELIEGKHTPTWRDLKACDVVFIQRPDVPTFVDAVVMAKALKKPIWIDYDDFLTNLPISNPAHTHYWQESVQKSIQACLHNADILSFSTLDLANRMCPREKEAIVIPNAWDNALFPDRKIPTQKAFTTIAWRGSQTHDKDILSVLTDIEHISEEQGSKVNWQFFGNPSWQVLERISSSSKLDITPWTGLLPYMMALETSQPDIAIIPLYDDEFNRCKSNCGWLEFTRVGAITLAPNLPEFQRPGITNYDTPDNFGAALRQLINLPFEERKKLWEQSWQHIASDLRLTRINSVRLRLLERLVRPQ